MTTITETDTDTGAGAGAITGMAIDIIDDAAGIISDPRAWTLWYLAIDRAGNEVHPHDPAARGWSIAGALSKAHHNRYGSGDVHYPAWKTAVQAVEIEAIRFGADSLQAANSGDQPYDHQQSAAEHHDWVMGLLREARQCLVDRLAGYEPVWTTSERMGALNALNNAWFDWQAAQEALRQQQAIERETFRHPASHLAPQSPLVLRLMRTAMDAKARWRIARGCVAAALISIGECRFNGAAPVYICLQEAQRQAGLPDGPNGNDGFYQDWVKRNAANDAQATT